MTGYTTIPSGTFFAAQLEPGTFHQKLASAPPDRPPQPATDAAAAAPHCGCFGPTAAEQIPTLGLTLPPDPRSTASR